ncbi:hypothetical protein SAMN06295967_1026 [Belliella buryatensis]|uniref:Uncharacterized protein n=1 Tax=Belliella buryatensis TaxID=1500549 RepID=A0A239AYV6_9BACT|nr:hypothetical protein [Belliella buryatensis]SNS00689.1 hypothetical protein SAMN06295967_1026 [Belliella buryatensis]
MKYQLTFICIMLFVTFVSAQEIPSKAIQIKTALLAAPDELKEGAMIYGYDERGDFIVLRKGSNDLICLADDPKTPGFNASCYHKDLDIFMERGRQLKKEGKNAKEIFDIREAEAKSGKLKMPKDGATLFVLTADEADYDPKTGEVKDSYLRYVVYIPWATSESTGLPLRPSGPAMPWIMDPGTHRAHIMINPPRN